MSPLQRLLHVDLSVISYRQSPVTHPSNLTASSRDTCDGWFFIGMDHTFVCSTFGFEHCSTFQQGRPNDGQVGREVNGKTASTYYNPSALEFSLL